ncbi:SDR family oxidoreductase [Pseudomonas sp. NPDC086251]|uniref:SDR family oxidoreductase n=1 Tax=Pseudomonas sp. NPDC086251 TaxID=3364431 RepID=UPI003833FEE1
MNRKALIVGVTGIIGNNLAHHLLNNGWEVFGIARKPYGIVDGVKHIAADLHDVSDVRAALKGVDPTHVFYTSWQRHATEAENIKVNGLMIRNLLDALRGSETVEHVALVTGLKHFLGPFELYGKGLNTTTPFREIMTRLDIENFYYEQEDELFAAAEREGFSWTVHRPHTVIGYALGNAMNMGMTLATYAAICKETARPFMFPGNKSQWEGLTDVTDARLLAEHLEWAAITTEVRNRPLHVVNGDTFRWSWMWGRIAQWFDLEPVPFDGNGILLETQMADGHQVWEDMARKYKLKESSFDRMASPWHTDADLGRRFECLTDMSDTRELGFTGYRTTDKVFFDLFHRLRSERIIP